MWNGLYHPAQDERCDECGRVFYWDNLKFVAITLVVVGHFVFVTQLSPAMSAIRFSIYLFHMPLFVFVSGYFSKSFVKGHRFKVEKIISYLSLWVALKVALFLADRLMLGTAWSQFTFLSAGDLPWYMLSMAAWLTTVFLVKDISPKYVMAASIVFAVVAGYSPVFSSTFSASRIVTFAPFFLLGFYVDKQRAWKTLETRWLPVAALAFLASLLAVVFVSTHELHRISGFFSGLNSYASLGLPVLGGPVRLAVMGFSALTGFAVMCLVPRRRLLIAALGSRTLQIYCLHYFLVDLFVRYRIGNALQTYVPSLWKPVVILIGIAVTFALSARFFEPPFRWVMSWKLATARHSRG